eukprot:g7538.t1
MSYPVLEYLASSLWTQKTLSDVQLQFEDKTFALHKVLLFQSPYLRRLLERSTNSIYTLTPSDSMTTAEALELCLASLYGITPSLTTDNVYNVLSAARLLELDELCQLCIIFMQERISPEVFKAWHSISLTWEGGKYCEEVKEVLEIFLCRTAYTDSREILASLPNEDLERILTCRRLWVPTEAQRFELILIVYKTKCNSVSDETHSVGNEVRHSSGDSTTTIERELDLYQSESTTTTASFDLNNCKTSNQAFFETLLESSNIYYHNFGFADLITARKQVMSLGFSKIAEAIDKSLWSKAALEHFICDEARKSMDLTPGLSIDENTIDESSAVIQEYLELEDHLSTLRFSTEISDLLTYTGSTPFSSDPVYFAGSLFRVVLSMTGDEPAASNSSLGIYLQRTVMSDMKSCTFSDPRSKIDVLLEFIAGTNIIEDIELEGPLETPCSNIGYSAFLPVSELSQYLSPTGTLRVTVILKMLFL